MIFVLKLCVFIGSNRFNIDRYIINVSRETLINYFPGNNLE